MRFFRLPTTAEDGERSARASSGAPLTAMAASAVAGGLGIVTLLLAPGASAYLGLYGVVVVTVCVMARTLRGPRRPPAAWAWWFLAVAIASVGVGTFASGLLTAAMGTEPNWFLVPGLLWVASYVCIIVGEAGIVTRHWGGRPDRATVVDGLVVAIAVLVPTVSLAASFFSATPGPLAMRLILASYIVLDGLVGLMLLQLLLNGDRRVAGTWFMAAGVSIPVVADFAAVVLRASIDPRYLAVGWICSYVLVQFTMLHPSLSRMTERTTSREVRLEGSRSVILALALFAVPMTVVLGPGNPGPLATAALLLASATVAILVLMRLTWLFRDNERAHASVEARERYFRALVQNIGDVIVVADANGAIRYRSPSAGHLFGFTEEGLALSVLDFVVEDDRDAATALFMDALARPGELISGEVRSRRSDGSALWLDLTVHNLTEDPDVGNIVLACRDVSERRLLEDQLRQEARHDALTGLPNRVLAFERLERMIERATRSGAQVGVMFADLDNFKTVNDSLGHGAGDSLLRSVADRLANAVRPGDTVARLGGDEFVLLAEMSDPRGFEALAKRVVASLAEPVEISGHEVLVTVSVGVAVAAPGEGGEDVLRKADVALYSAKHAGRNVYRIYEDDGRGQGAVDLDQAAALRRALESGEQLRVHFQPIVQLATGRISGVEALVRWQHPERGLLLPASFVPMAEANGLIVPLGRWVLEEACRQIAAAGASDLELAVNISARQLEDDALHDVISGALERSGIHPSRLTLELTETVLMREGDMGRRLRQLKDLGLRLAVDDFGTGYSSLAYLQQFPIDTLKVDRQFMAAISTDEAAAALARGVIDLARTVGLHTVAEGIEEDGQAELLRLLGCDAAQGYLFARPAPLPKVLELMRAVAPTGN